MLYPIEEEKRSYELMANLIPQPVSYTLSNMVAIFEDYFTGFFDKEYFKTVRMKTEDSFTKTLKEMTKIKEKPMLLIDPSDINMMEGTLFNNNLMNRFNPYDSRGTLATAMYQSVPYFDDGTIVMSYRTNRYQIRFDIMMVESSFANMLNLYNRLVMGIRHRSKFSIERNILVSVPTPHIRNLAKFKKMDYKTEEFLKYLNANSTYPIVRRIYGSGHLMFFMVYNTRIAVEVPDVPSKDGFNRNGMVEGAHRITDIFSFDAEFPCENLIIFPDTFADDVIGVETDPQDLLYISPLQSDVEIYNIAEFTLVNSIDAVADTNDCSMNIYEVIDLPDEYYPILKDYAKNHPIDQIIKVDCRVNNVKVNEVSFDQNGLFTILQPDLRNLYHISIYINRGLVNDLIIQLNQNKIGTVVLD